MKKVAFITESWPTIGIDSIYLNVGLRKNASNLDITIYTTSQYGYSIVSGDNNIIIHRIESVPFKWDYSFFKQVNELLEEQKPDICHIIAPPHDFIPKQPVNIAHWPGVVSSAYLNNETVERYTAHTMFEDKHKNRLLGLGVSEEKIYLTKPNTVHLALEEIYTTKQ